VVEEGVVVLQVVLLLRLQLLHFLHLMQILLRWLLWPHASAARILQRHKHKDKFCLQCNWIPIMMLLVIVVVGVRVTKLPHLQGLVNNLLVLHMFLMLLVLVLMLLV
jgi:hypothetical protein